MGMRVTTGMSMNLYRYNLQNSTANVNNSRNTVLTHRKFSSYGEAPAAATQAWRVRRAMYQTDIYTANNNDTYTRFNIAWATLGQAGHDLEDLDGRSSDIYAASDSTASGRSALGLVLRQTAESVAQTMNGAKSGESFLFSGNDELNAAFSWDGDMLLYRGVPVNAGGVHEPTEDPVPDRWGDIDPETKLPSKFPVETSRLDTVDRAWYDYYEAKAAFDKGESTVNPDGDPTANPIVPSIKPFDMKLPPSLDVTQGAEVDDFGVPKIAYQIVKNGTYNNGTTTVNANKDEILWAARLVDQGNLEKLNRMSKEEVPIDLGMGMLEDDNGKLVDGTYFNRSLPGINMLGYGVDEDGDPKNACMILMRLGQIYENCHEETGSYDKDDSSGGSEKAKAIREEATRLIDKLKASQSFVTGNYVEVTAKASYLDQNEDRLKLQGDYLAEQRAEIEDVDLADAISQFSWDYYCYSAALKVGTQLLSQSLIDYMS